jgi:hypothetical protein
LNFKNKEKKEKKRKKKKKNIYFNKMNYRNSPHKDRVAKISEKLSLIQ